MSGAGVTGTELGWLIPLNVGPTDGAGADDGPSIIVRGVASPIFAVGVERIPVPITVGGREAD